jgi:endonuclease-8
MPEGPEIHRSADEVAEAIAGRETTEVFFAFENLKSYEPMLTGEKVTDVQAKGKAILINFANGLTIYTHNQLYGKWIVCPAKEYPDTNRQLRLAIHNQHCSALLYSASEIEVLRREKLKTHPFLSNLGPDLLDRGITIEQVVDRFMHKQFYRRKLSSLLLDQQFLAGIGNYLRSEILFVAGVHPSLRPADCSGQQIRQLAEAALNLTRQSYQTGGVTLEPELVERLQEEGYDRDNARFWVFNREGEPCFKCGTPIVKEEVGGRRLYYCPQCQQEES